MKAEELKVAGGGAMGGGCKANNPRFLDSLALVCFMETSFDSSLADNIMGLGSDFETWLADDLSIGYVLIACLGIAAMFVAYKVIKRALNKA